MERNADTPLKTDLNSIMEEINRITKIITGLLTFSRKGNMELKKANIMDEIESALVLVEKDLQLGGIEIKRNFDLTPVMVTMDRDGIRQVFLNIINNAKHAISGGGTLTVTAEKIDYDSGLQHSSAEINVTNPKNFLRIKFSDTGGGIEENGIEKIFEPFFTTKPEGTGLGLSISYSIIERHGGNMEIESAFGVGTSVIINLPIQS